MKAKVLDWGLDSAAPLPTTPIALAVFGHLLTLWDAQFPQL